MKLVPYPCLLKPRLTQSPCSCVRALLPRGVHRPAPPGGQPWEVKQIAGRAGRFGSPHPTGYVTCLAQGDMHALHDALSTPSEPVARACLLPR